MTKTCKKKKKKDERLHAVVRQNRDYLFRTAATAAVTHSFIYSSNHLPAIAVLPASFSSPRQPVGTRLFLLHLRLAVIGHVQRGVVVATVLHKVKFLGAELYELKEHRRITGALVLCTCM